MSFVSTILPSLQINGYVCIWPFEQASLAYRTYHSVQIRKVGSCCLLSTLLKQCYMQSWCEKISRWTYEEVCLVGWSLCFDVIRKNLLVSGLCKTLWLGIGWKPSRLIEKLRGQMRRFSEINVWGKTSTKWSFYFLIDNYEIVMAGYVWIEIKLTWKFRFSSLNIDESNKVLWF